MSWHVAIDLRTIAVEKKLIISLTLNTYEAAFNPSTHLADLDVIESASRARFMNAIKTSSRYNLRHRLSCTSLSSSAFGMYRLSFFLFFISACRNDGGMKIPSSSLTIGILNLEMFEFIS